MIAERRYSIVLTDAATNDLQSIAAYLAEHRSPEAAVDWAAAMLERIEQLEHFPDRGSIPRELEAMGRERYRQIVSGKYRVFYRVDGSRVIVFLVVDGRRDVAALLRDRLLGAEGGPAAAPD